MRAISLLLLLGACGSDVPSGGKPLDPGQAQALCQDTCAHEVSCGWLADGTACESECTAQSSLFRGDGYRAWLDCLTGADCGAGNVGEACYVEAVADTPPRGVHNEYASRCTAARGTCALPAGVCDIDQVQLFSDSYVTNQVLPCFDMECSALVMCLETYVLDAF